MKKTVSAFILGITALSAPNSVFAETLDVGEETHLVFMREEEKLARDVYMKLQEMYPGEAIFVNIGTGSEQEHTDTIRNKLAQYGIADPNPDTNNLPDSIGVFTGTDYGWYFEEKYEILVNWGAQSLVDGWYVGAFIEELDMVDIIGCPKIIVETDNGIGAGECGMDYTDKVDLKTMYGHLVSGSEDHLRAYVKNIENVIGEGNYEAQVLSQEQVDAILGR